MAIVKRERTSAEIMMYALFLYFRGLSFRNISTLAYDSKYCIVGEAWGYNGRHAGYYIAPLIPLIGCWKCVKFGREMGKIAKLHGPSCTNNLQPVINHFLEHWNKRHRDVTIKNTLHTSI
jgi:hypothetical protein